MATTMASGDMPATGPHSGVSGGSPVPATGRPSRGDEWEFGLPGVSAAEIKAFAHEWDPRPYHLDEGAASASVFAGLVASGLHTLVLSMRLLTASLELPWIAGRGFRDVRFLRPLRPDSPARLGVRVAGLHEDRRRARVDLTLDLTLCGEATEEILMRARLDAVVSSEDG